MILSDITTDPNIESFWLGLIKSAHLWDDLIDKDNQPDDKEIHSIFFFMLTELPNNPFYKAYQHVLSPVITSAAINYVASANLEAEKRRHDLSHVLRYALGDVICTISLIVKGKEFTLKHSHEIWEMIVDDSLEKYKLEQLCLASSK